MGSLLHMSSTDSRLEERRVSSLCHTSAVPHCESGRVWLGRSNSWGPSRSKVCLACNDLKKPPKERTYKKGHQVNMHAP